LILDIIILVLSNSRNNRTGKDCHYYLVYVSRLPSSGCNSCAKAVEFMDTMDIMDAVIHVDSSISLLESCHNPPGRPYRTPFGRRFESCRAHLPAPKNRGFLISHCGFKSSRPTQADGLLSCSSFLFSCIRCVLERTLLIIQFFPQ